MKAFLMHRDRDFDLHAPVPPQAADLVQDLDLSTLTKTLAAGDAFLLEVAGKAILSGSCDLDEIRYRQDILKDSLQFPRVIRQAYGLTVQAIEDEKKIWRSRADHPSWVLNDAIRLMDIVVPALKGLRNLADSHGETVQSQGLRRLFAMLRAELDDAYFVGIQQHLKTMRFRNGLMIAAKLGQGNKGRDYFPCTPKVQTIGWFRRLFAKRPKAYSYSVDPRDESGAKALSELTDRGVNEVANALAQSSEHIFSFLAMLRAELGFYVGALNLHDRLGQLEVPSAFPVPLAAGERRQDVKGAYDASLALNLGRRLVGNDLQGNPVSLVILTGANQGGKTTFLRALGLAQLMMQCGLFVPAEAFTGPVCAGLFTHFKREEDASMISGKFAEELGRMSQIVDLLRPDAMILFNESFAATNEREGSEIARQVVGALVAKAIKVVYVTHLYEFAHGVHEDPHLETLFLRAERPVDGQRSFKLEVGEPLPTSFGLDLYRQMFEESPIPAGGAS